MNVPTAAPGAPLTRASTTGGLSIPEAGNGVNDLLRRGAVGAELHAGHAGAAGGAPAAAAIGRHGRARARVRRNRRLGPGAPQAGGRAVDAPAHAAAGRSGAAAGLSGLHRGHAEPGGGGGPGGADLAHPGPRLLVALPAGGGARLRRGAAPSRPPGRRRCRGQRRLWRPHPGRRDVLGGGGAVHHHGRRRSTRAPCASPLSSSRRRGRG